VFGLNGSVSRSFTDGVSSKIVIISGPLPKLAIPTNFTITMARTKKSLAEQYWPYLVKFFWWLDGTVYDNGHELSNDDFACITPEALVRYMKLLAYGTKTPGPNDKPTLCRSTGLAQSKKAISYFMPD
jgi:hypothetical protein